jgi:hypothetical protein
MRMKDLLADITYYPCQFSLDSTFKNPFLFYFDKDLFLLVLLAALLAMELHWPLPLWPVLPLRKYIYNSVTAACDLERVEPC